MRVLLIDDDPRFRALVRHHLTCGWPDAQIDAYDPVARGPLHEGYLAQAYDVVLLDHAWPGGEGFAWLADFGSRPGFAPVIYLAADDSEPLAQAALRAGAFAVVPTQKIDHERLMSAVRGASPRTITAYRRDVAGYLGFLALHEGGPMGAEALTIERFVVRGEGQRRHPPMG